MDTVLIDSRSQASEAVKHLLQGRDGGFRISEQSIQGQERGVVVNFPPNQAMQHHHVILFPPNLLRGDRPLLHVEEQICAAIVQEQKSSGALMLCKAI